MDPKRSGGKGLGMSNEHNQTVRDTLRGAVGGAGLFGAVAVIQALRAGMGIGQVTQPILVFILIGLTVGGLAGPLIGRAIQGHRGR